MDSIAKNVYIDKLDDIATEYNNTYENEPYWCNVKYVYGLCC